MLLMKEIENSITYTFAQYLHKIREEKGLSMEKLAELANTSRVWISNIENGKAPQVSLDIAYRLSKALGVTLNEMIEEHMAIDEDTAFEMLKKARERKKLQQG